MRYMKNRSGVVSYYRQDLVNQANLDFRECDIDGVIVEHEEVPLEEKLVQKQSPKTGKKKKKKVTLTESLNIEE